MAEGSPLDGPAAAAGGATSRASLRAQVRTFAGAAIVLVVVGVTFAGLAFIRLLDARSVLVDRIDPASSDTQRVLAALVDQETGVRGYVLTGTDEFLLPYTAGLVREAQLDAQLQAELVDLPDAEDAFEQMLASAERWRNEYAVPTIAAVRVGLSGPAAKDALATGKALFDDMRTNFDALDRELREARFAARDRLSTATYQLGGVLAGFSLVGLVSGIGVGVLFRRRVRLPLEALGDDARRVAGGELAHEVHSVGPTELRVLAADIESMRRRIVDELVVVSEARTSLEVQTRALARSNAELEQFAYVASHDLQEPLRKVAAFCQLLQQRYGGQLDDRADQYIDFAVDGAKRMQALINDLLAFSRVGRRSGPMVDVDCNAAFDDAVDNLADRIEAAGAVVTRTQLPTVRGELALVTALFQNLIGNAVKFARPDIAPVVSVGCVRVLEDDGGSDGGHWELAVVDNGIGIEPQHADRVFTIFQRLHSKAAYEGTGIGLALCRKIVEDHGGRIWIDSGPDAGTTIRFTLPVIGEATGTTRPVRTA